MTATGNRGPHETNVSWGETTSRSSAVAAAAILLALAPALDPHGALRGQQTGEEGEAALLISGVAFRHERNAGKSWQPGVSLGIRAPLGSRLVAEVTATEVRTRREREIVCLGVGACPDPGHVSGSARSLVASLGVRLALGELVAVPSVGYGQMWDEPPSDMLRYGGPSWVAGASIGRRVGDRTALELSYRVFRMHWDNDYDAVLQGVHLVHHQLAIGLAYSPWAGEPS